MERHSTSPPCGNLVDGLPHDCHTEPWWIGVTLAPRRFMIMVDIFMFLVTFHIRSYWFVTFRSFILYWSLIFCEFQLLSSTKPRLTTSRCLRQNVEKWWNFRFFMKIRIKNLWIWKFIFDDLPMEEIQKSRLWMRWSALRVPGGNQVDGLPPARHS